MDKTTRKRLIGAMTLALGAFVLWAFGSDLAGTARALHARDPVLASEPLALGAVLASIFMFAITAVCFMPEPRLDARANPADERSRRQMRIGRGIFAIGGAFLLASGFGPSLQFAIVDGAARDRGYVRCPERTEPRRQPDRWALPARSPAAPTARCPAAAG